MRVGPTGFDDGLDVEYRRAEPERQAFWLKQENFLPLTEICKIIYIYKILLHLKCSGRRFTKVSNIYCL